MPRHQTCATRKTRCSHQGGRFEGICLSFSEEIIEIIVMSFPFYHYTPEMLLLVATSELGANGSTAKCNERSDESSA